MAERIFAGAYRLGLYAPWVWLALVAVFAVGVSLQVGHWPTYANPDPKLTGPFVWLYFVVMYALDLVLASPIIVIACSLAARLIPNLRVAPRGLLLFYVVGLGLFVFVVFSDFLGVMDWLLD